MNFGCNDWQEIRPSVYSRQFTRLPSFGCHLYRIATLPVSLLESLDHTKAVQKAMLGSRLA
jgi:hypothetical protein